MIERAKTAFSALSEDGQVRFLAALAYQATIWARGMYPNLTNDIRLSADALCSFNELEHKVTDHIAHLLESDPKRYPDEVFISIVFEMAEKAKCERQISQMFQDLHQSYLETQKKK